MSKAVVYITEPDEISNNSLEMLVNDFEIVAGNAEFKKNVQPGIEVAVIRSRTSVTREVIDQLPELKAIIRVGVGLDTIDLEVCRERGIKIYNSSGANANAVAEYVVGMILLGLRNWHKIKSQDLINWDRFKFLGRELKGKKVGVIGFGHIGRLVVEKLSSMGVREFVVFDPYVRQEAIDQVRWVDQIDEVLSQAEIVTLHLPLTTETEHLIDKSLLALLKTKAILINTSRGGIVDEIAVLETMKRIKGIYIADVFETEPVVPSELIGEDQIIATPHIASMTEEANEAMAREAVENFLTGMTATLPPTSATQVNSVINQ